jgi:ATP-binding cassette, subfamily B, bacterial
MLRASTALCGFYQPSSDRVTIDGVDLSEIDFRVWRSTLTGAFQDFVKFEYPLAESVGIGDLTRITDRTAVTAALRKAGAEDLATSLGSGLDTQLGASWKDGVELSHGQWQKIALARGFMIEQPLMVVLDEPTSALEPR